MLILGRAEQSANVDGISFFISDPFDLEMKDYQSQLDEITATKIAHSFIQSHDSDINNLATLGGNYEADLESNSQIRNGVKFYII